MRQGSSKTWIPPKYDSERPFRSLTTPESWHEAMQIIAELHHLSTADWQPFSSGSDVVYGNADAVIKLSAPCWLTDIETEAAILDHTHGLLEVQTPELIGSGRLSEWPYVVMTRLKDPSIGEVWPTLSSRERVDLASRLGAMTAALHSAPLPKQRGGWEQFLDDRVSGVLDHHRRVGATEVWLGGIEAFVEEVERPERPLALLHTELLQHHILVCQRGGVWHPSGLIDFADARIGHPDYDYAALVEFVFRSEPGCLRACMRAAGWTPEECSPEGSRRLVAWGLLHKFGSLPRVLEVAGEPAPVGFRELAERVYPL